MTAVNSVHNRSAWGPIQQWASGVGGMVRLLLRAPRGRGASWTFDWRQPAVAAGCGLVAFVFCITWLDASVTRAVLTLPPAIPWFFNRITDFGKSGVVLWPLGILLVLLTLVPQRRLTRMSQLVLAATTARVGFLFLAVGVPGIFVTVIKRLVGRARPMVTGDVNPFAFDMTNWSAAWASLPSGHAATVFSVLVAFGSLWPRARWALWIYALAIAASRIAVLAHFPSDVLAGALVGTAGALMVRRYFALRRLAFTVADNGAIRRLPGPSRPRIKAVARDLLAP